MDSCINDTTFIVFNLIKISIKEGIYQGTFSITENFSTDSAETRSGFAQFIFDDSTYSCYGSFPTGGGAFYIDIDSLILRDQVPHTADFDWSLILNGAYLYRYDGSKLYLRQLDRFNRFREMFLSIQ